MKKILIALLLMLALAFCLVACNGNDTPDTPDNGDVGDTPGGDGNTDEPTPGDGIDWENTGLDGLALIYNGKARFQVVYTAESGAAALRTANAFVERLRELNIEVADPVSDTDASKVAACEIIIGLNAQNRGNDVSVLFRELGKDGFAIKTVGTKIVIAGGSDVRLENTYKNYLKDQMGITNKTKKLTELAVPADYSVFTPTEYSIEYVKIGGNDLADYTLFIDVSGAKGFSTSTANNFRENLFAATGYWLELGNNSDIASTDKKVVIRCNGTIAPEYEKYGFAAYVDKTKSLIIECTYANAFDGSLEKFLDEKLFGSISGVSFGSDFEYTSYASRVYYGDFGAKGDGVVDDYNAMYNAHVFANQCGQTVYADAGKTYYVHVFHNGSIPVKTNVELGDANIIINDLGSEVYSQRSLHLYEFVRDNPVVKYNEQQVKDMFGNVTLSLRQESIPWLVDELKGDSMVVFENSYHMDFVRKGSNENDGAVRTDVLYVYADGTVHEDTPVIFEFEKITSITIYGTDDAPITFSGGNFTNICCRTVAETSFVNKYHSYGRGLNISRSNVTIKNVTHRMQDEPLIDIAGSGSNYGYRNESYPYYGFLAFKNSYNITVEDCDLTGHTQYYQDKTTSGTPVSMGTYDITMETAIMTYFNRIVQNGVDIKDQRYWGIMGTNRIKNVHFTDSTISRFDAHCGFWNASLTNTTIGLYINVIGGGELYMENVTKLTDDNFMALRSDYGATFEGDITLINCELVGYKTYNSMRGDSFTNAYCDYGYVVESGYNSTDTTYLEWDFGYTCYMPQNIYLDNFISKTASTYVFNDLSDSAFDDAYLNTYVITKSITYKNMNPLAICKSPTNTRLLAIPVTVIKDSEE